MAVERPEFDLARTTWKIVSLPDRVNEVAIFLQVDTTAPSVIAAIEDAAERAKIEIHRIEEID